MNRPGFTYENRGFDDVVRALLSVDISPSLNLLFSTCLSVSVFLSVSIHLSIGIYPSIYLCLYIETLFTPVRMPPTPPHSMMTPLAQSPFAFRMIHSRKTSAASSTSVSRKRGRTVIVTGRICR